MKDLDQKILDIQKSTRTLFKMFLPLHDKLRLRSRLYYNWHLNWFSSPVHYSIGFLFLLAIIYSIVSAYGIVGASKRKSNDIASTNIGKETNDPGTNLTPSESDNTAQNTSIVDEKVLGQIGQISQIATNEIVKIISEKMAPLPFLSSENTQTQIKNIIESDLAKDKNIITMINKIDSQSQINETLYSDLSSAIAKISTEATLEALNEKIETGLAKDETIQLLTEQLSSDMSDLKKALSETLTVSISNWAASYTISNFPSDYSSSSTERSQEQIGKEYFQRSEGFFAWAVRQNYGKTAHSGRIDIPTSGQTKILDLATPANHTYYATQISFSSINEKDNWFSVNFKPIDGDENNVAEITYEKTGTYVQDFNKKIKTGEYLQIIMNGVKDSKGTSSATINYIDLPWEE